MNEGGANEPTPIVHNGIIYLANTSNIVQALDGRTGELIWENHVGPNATAAYGATRSLGIYQDKVFVATTDAQLVRARRAHRQDRLADRDRRSEEGLQQYQRPARHQRQSRAGTDGLRRSTGTRAASSAPTTPRPASSSGSSRPWRARASRAATPGASFRTCCAPAARRGSPAATIPISI